MKYLVSLVFIVSCSFTAVIAQFRTLQSIPDLSPKCIIAQSVGITQIKIEYYSPSVRGRKIFGGEVPYNEGKPFPWRAGANENTVISFSDDVQVEGNALKAGSYGIHMIPAEDEWVVIFSTNATSFGNAGAFHMYNQAEDALRVKVKPQEIEFQETLNYDLMNRTDSTVQVALRWEKTSIPFTIEVDVKNVVLAHLKAELRGTAGLAWEGWNAAAQYCLRQNFELEEGLQFVNRSISGGWDAQPTFENLATKTQLLLKLERKEEAAKVMAETEKYLVVANNWDVVNLALIAHEFELSDACLDMLESNLVNNKDFWGAHYGMAVFYNRTGDKKKALKYAITAKEICENDRAKNWIAGQITKVENGENI